jgi:hypothetical protein
MKTILIKFTLMSLLMLLGISCSNNDQPNPTPSCQNIDILGIIFNPADIGNAGSSQLFGYLNNATSTSTLNTISTISVTNPSTPSYLQMSSTNNAVYNPINGEYKLVIAKERRMITLNSIGAITHTPIVTGLPSPDITNAPVYLNGNLFFGHISNASSDLLFDVLDSNFMSVKTILIPAANLSGNNDWNFTSATNGIDELYFAVANNIIIYNTVTNTISANMVTGAPIPSGTIIGLEFKENDKLYALHEDWISSLVELNIANPTSITKTTVIDLDFHINYQYCSTTYNECNQKYYLSTLAPFTSGIFSRNLRIDLAGTPKIVEDFTTLGWIVGMTLKK